MVGDSCCAWSCWCLTVYDAGDDTDDDVNDDDDDNEDDDDDKLLYFFYKSHLVDNQQPLR